MIKETTRELKWYTRHDLFNAKQRSFEGIEEQNNVRKQSKMTDINPSLSVKR